MSKIYHIYVNPKLGVTQAQIEEILNLGQDWLRYDNKCWLVKTTSNAKKWHARLEKCIEPGGQMLITQLNPADYWGHMPKTIWDWLTKAKKDVIPE